MNVPSASPNTNISEHKSLRVAPRRDPLHVTVRKFDAIRLALGVTAKQ